MSNVKWKILIFTTLLCLVPIIIGVYYYNDLPNMVAIHFNFQGKPDSFAPKVLFVFGFPLLMAILQAFICYKNDVVNKGLKTPRVEYIFKSILPLVSFVIYLLSIGITLGVNLDLRKIMLVFLGVLFMLIGNYMPKTSGSYRTKVTLNWGIFKNYYNIDSNERKKHYTIYGYLLFVTGLLYVIAIFFNETVTIFLVTGTIVLMMIYSIWFYMKVSKNS